MYSISAQTFRKVLHLKERWLFHISSSSGSNFWVNSWVTESPVAKWSIDNSLNFIEIFIVITYSASYINFM